MGHLSPSCPNKEKVYPNYNRGGRGRGGSRGGRGGRGRGGYGRGQPSQFGNYNLQGYQQSQFPQAPQHWNPPSRPKQTWTVEENQPYFSLPQWSNDSGKLSGVDGLHTTVNLTEEVWNTVVQYFKEIPNDNRPNINVEVEGCAATALIDSGSQVNLMNITLWEQIKEENEKIQLQGVTTILRPLMDHQFMFWENENL